MLRSSTKALPLQRLLPALPPVPLPLPLPNRQLHTTPHHSAADGPSINAHPAFPPAPPAGPTITEPASKTADNPLGLEPADSGVRPEDLPGDNLRGVVPPGEGAKGGEGTGKEE